MPLTEMTTPGQGGGGGGSSVKTGTFSISTASQEVEIDHGLGTDIDHIVIFYKSSDSAYSASPYGAVIWGKDDPTQFKLLSVGGNPTGARVVVGNAYNAAPVVIQTRPDQNNGVFTVKASGTIGYSQGDFVWYAE